MSILSVWLALIGLGYGANDGFDNFMVGAVLAAGNSNGADDQYGNIAADLKFVGAVSNSMLADSPFSQLLKKIPKVPTECFSPFNIKCSLLL